MTAFRTRRQVEFSDTDMAGIVHFANFFRFMEAAEHAYLRACGLGVYLDWQGERITFPRVACACDYRKPARFPDELDVEVRVEHMGRTSLRYAFTFRRGEELIAEGRITAVLCRVVGQSLEPFEIPAPLRERLAGGAG
jgi:YbgC/YbaW family acyl-CoA thioester hydrolase